MLFRNVIGRAVCGGLGVVAPLTFLNLLTLVQPTYMLQVYRVLASSSLATLAYLTLIAVFVLMIIGAIEAIRQVVVQRVGSSLEIDVGERLLIASLSGAERGQDAPALVRDLAQARSFIASPVFTALLDAPFSPLFLLIVFLILIHPLLGDVDKSSRRGISV